MNERLNHQGSQLYLVSKDIYYLEFQIKLGFEFNMSSIDIVSVILILYWKSQG